METLKPQHINAASEDLQGNAGIGRYIFLTGSDARALDVSKYFQEVRMLPHPRQHNLYLGKLPTPDGGYIDVAAISSGMGGSSVDIIINELVALGARRILRVGTAGSIQPEQIKVGDIVIATAAVRDDKSSWDYIYQEYPALASLPYIIAAGRAAKKFATPCYMGIVHSKSSLYAREFGYSLMDNNKYMSIMKLAGVVATEMESAQLFTLASLLTAKLRNASAENIPILAGAILAIVGDDSPFSSDEGKIQQVIERSILLSLETTQQLYLIDRHEAELF